LATWIIGDIQGCHASLQSLFQKLDFRPGRDRLWLVGDLVNRGPDSLRVLRSIRALGDAAVTVLGNHDLHLLAMAEGLGRPNPEDTLQQVLDAPDRDELLDWLAARPLIHRDGKDVLVHAGISPAWSLEEAQACADEVCSELRRPDRRPFLSRMYGNKPERWQQGLSIEERQRYAVNAFTRMRFVNKGGALLMKTKFGPDAAPSGVMPWFLAPHRRPPGYRVFFGHWSMLGQIAWPDAGVWGLDTGCIWNGRLTAINRETLEIVSVPAAPGDGRSPI
jgi:bis(5'-nucleosyl)-tetraphosphatase (symmetrical)